MVINNIDLMGDVSLPFGWNFVPLGKCLSEKLSYGINAPAVPYTSSLPCYIRITDITEDGRYDNSDRKSVRAVNVEKYSLKYGDIVLARTGSVGKSYLYNTADGNLIYAGYLIKASIDCLLYNPKFIAAQLKTKRFWRWVSTISMRSIQPGINSKEYASFLIPIPPKKEQDVISKILLEFDTYIDNLAELIGKKKNIREGALEDLVSGRKRLDTFSSKWDEKLLGEFIKIQRGASPRPIEIYLTKSRNGINWIKIGDAPRYDKYINSTKEKITPEGMAHSVNVYPGDFILSNSMSFGRPYILNISGCIHDGWLRLYDFHKNITNEFLYYLLSSSYVQNQYAGFAAGSGVQNLNKDVVKKVLVQLPPLQEQNRIAEVLTAMDQEIEALEEKLNKMIQIRESAMEELLMGHIRLVV